MLYLRLQFYYGKRIRIRTGPKKVWEGSKWEASGHPLPLESWMVLPPSSYDVCVGHVALLRREVYPNLCCAVLIWTHSCTAPQTPYSPPPPHPLSPRDFGLMPMVSSSSRGQYFYDAFQSPYINYCYRKPPGKQRHSNPAGPLTSLRVLELFLPSNAGGKREQGNAVFRRHAQVCKPSQPLALGELGTEWNAACPNAFGNRKQTHCSGGWKGSPLLY